MVAFTCAEHLISIRPYGSRVEIIQSYRLAARAVVKTESEFDILPRVAEGVAPEFHFSGTSTM